MDANATEAEDFAFMMVAGGGGGSGRSPSYPNYGSGGGGGAGGYIARTGPTLGLPYGSYTVTIGAGGASPPVPPAPPPGAVIGVPKYDSVPPPPAPLGVSVAPPPAPT